MRIESDPCTADLLSAFLVVSGGLGAHRHDYQTLVRALYKENHWPLWLDFFFSASLSHTCTLQESGMFCPLEPIHLHWSIGSSLGGDRWNGSSFRFTRPNLSGFLFRFCAGTEVFFLHTPLANMDLIMACPLGSDCPGSGCRHRGELTRNPNRTPPPKRHKNKSFKPQG
jgi:hypothetical protein